MAMAGKFGYIFTWGLFFILGVYILYEISTAFVAENVTNVHPLRNAGMFPKLLAQSMLLFCFIKLCTTFFFSKYNNHADEVEKEWEYVPFTNICWLVVALLLVYISVLETLGYYISSTIFMIICCTILQKKFSVLTILIPLGVVIGVGWVLESILALVLPIGLWEITLS